MAAGAPANAIATTAAAQLPRAASTTTTAQELDSTLDRTFDSEFLSPSPQIDAESSTSRSGRRTSRHGYSNSFGGLSSLWGTSTAASSLTSNAQLNPEFAQLPTQRDRAAALRQLNGTSTPSPFSRSTSKASSSRTTLSSQPVIVRTYSGTRPRSSSSARPSSIAARGRMKTEPPPRLPKVEEFSFDGILRAVEPDIQGTIDAIAEICARSKMSLADEHASHIPPQGEITNPESTGPSLQPYRTLGQGWRITGYDHVPLTTVPEASSSSGGSRGSSDSGKRRRTSAYGSLKNLVTGKQRELGSTDKAGVPLETSGELNWAALVQQHPPVAIMTSPTASRQLSLDITTIDATNAAVAASSKQTGNEQVTSRPARATRSASLTSWIPLPWPTATATAPAARDDASTAETRLKDLLRSTSFAGTKTVSSYG